MCPFDDVIKVAPLLAHWCCCNLALSHRPYLHIEIPYTDDKAVSLYCNGSVLYKQLVFRGPMRGPMLTSQSLTVRPWPLCGFCGNPPSWGVLRSAFSPDNTVRHSCTAYVCGQINIGVNMMASSNGNIFRVTGLCEGNSPVTGEFPSQRPVTRSFDVFFDCAWINIWANNDHAGDLKRNCANYDVTLMTKSGNVANFIVTSGTAACLAYDNQRCHQRWKSWRHENSQSSSWGKSTAVVR